MPIEQFFEWTCDVQGCTYLTKWSDGFIPYGMQVLKANAPKGWMIIMEENSGRIFCPEHAINISSKIVEYLWK